MIRENDLPSYQKACLWMGLEKVKETPEAVSNRFHKHLKGCSRSVKEHNLLPRVRKGDLPSGEAPWPITIFLDNLRSAHNVGSILRTTEALRLGSIVLSEDTPGPEEKPVRDTSMGTHEWVSCKRAPLESLPRPLIVLETSPDATPLCEFTFPESFTLVIGNEEFGVSEALLAEADAIVEIPLRGRKNSLNVACAFSMAAEEIYRQRMRKT